jgi:ribonuclease Z
VIPIHEVLTGYSRAMYSSWLWHKPLQLIVDAGEGLQLALGARVWAPELLALTHGHSDHLLGLPGFIASRRFSKGAQDKPLRIVFPNGSRGAEEMRGLVDRLWPNESFPVTWIGMSPGDEVPIGRNRVLQAFPSSHGTSDPAFGYRVLEARRRLRPEFAGLPEAEVRDRARAGQRDELMEDYRHVLFAHTGDSMPIAAEWARQADLLVHDATFLAEEDRKWNIHATTGEALSAAREAEVKRLVLVHLSIRYPRPDHLPQLRSQVAASGFRGECWLLDDGRFVSVTAPPPASREIQDRPQPTGASRGAD